METLASISSCLRRNLASVLGVSLVLSLFLETATHAAALNAETLFAQDRLLEVKIVMPPKDWEALCRQSRGFESVFSGSMENPFTYFKGDIWVNGTQIESVGIRKKGFIGSLDGERPSLKIKFDEYVDQDPVDGLDRLTLNNNKQDSSLVSQYLTYRLFNEAGVHAPRVSYARVTVNGDYLGVYSHVESVRKPFLKRNFGKGSGSLYEGTLADFYPKAIDRMDAKNKAARNDRSQISQLAEWLASEDELPLGEVGALVDLSYFTKFWAIESLIGFWDGYSNNQNNYFAYLNPVNGKFYFIPWGADGAWSGSRGPFGGFGGGSNSVYAQGMLANRLYHSGDMADQYARVMRELLDKVWNEERLTAEIDRIEDLVSDHLDESQSRTFDAMDDVRSFIGSRRKEIMGELENWPVDVPDKPRRPMYVVDVGTVTGEFSAQWKGQPVPSPEEIGEAELNLKLDGESVTFKQVGATAHLEPPRQFGFGGGRGGRPGRGRGGPFGGPVEPPAQIILAGVRASDGEVLTLVLSMGREAFLDARGKTVKVRGSLRAGNAEGGFRFGPPGGGRTLQGDLTLSKAGLEDGDPVVGRIDLNITESRGGFFDRRGGGQGRGGPGRRGGPRPR